MEMDTNEERPPRSDDEEVESDGSWYFDLPSGAWERQEAKNRELREHVRENLNQPLQHEPFGGQREQHGGASGRFSTGHSEPQSGQTGHAEDLFGWLGDRDARAAADAESETAASRPDQVEEATPQTDPSWRQSIRDTNLPSAETAGPASSAGRAAVPPAGTEPAQPSKWDEFFGTHTTKEAAPAPAEGSIIDGMRQWAASGGGNAGQGRRRLFDPPRPAGVEPPGESESPPASEPDPTPTEPFTGNIESSYRAERRERWQEEPVPEQWTFGAEPAREPDLSSFDRWKAPEESQSEDEPRATGAAAPEPAASRGFFARLFGRKKVAGPLAMSDTIAAPPGELALVSEDELADLEPVRMPETRAALKPAWFESKSPSPTVSKTPVAEPQVQTEAGPTQAIDPSWAPAPFDAFEDQDGFPVADAPAPSLAPMLLREDDELPRLDEIPEMPSVAESPAADAAQTSPFGHFAAPAAEAAEAAETGTQERQESPSFAEAVEQPANEFEGAPAAEIAETPVAAEELFTPDAPETAIAGQDRATAAFAVETSGYWYDQSATAEVVEAPVDAPSDQVPADAVEAEAQQAPPADAAETPAYEYDPWARFLKEQAAQGSFAIEPAIEPAADDVIPSTAWRPPSPSPEPPAYNPFEQLQPPAAFEAPDELRSEPPSPEPLLPQDGPELAVAWRPEPGPNTEKAFEETSHPEPLRRGSFPSAPGSSEHSPAGLDQILGAGAEELLSEADRQRIDLPPQAQRWATPPRLVDEAQAGAALWSTQAFSPVPAGAKPTDWATPTDGGAMEPPWSTGLGQDGGASDSSQHRTGSRSKTLVRELVETGLLAVLVFLAVRASFQNFKVDGNSMFPTLEDGQFLIVNKLVYSEVDVEKLSKFIPFLDSGDTPNRYVFHGPGRGDIVVLQDPRKPDTDLIKRIIGLPNETVEIVDGHVYINDMLLEEPYIKTPWHDTKPKVLVPAGEYFVMGDNRDNSLDSRSAQVGFVPKELIIGKATLSYWPMEKFGLAPNEAGSLSEKDGRPKLTTMLIGAEAN